MNRSANADVRDDAGSRLAVRRHVQPRSTGSWTHHPTIPVQHDPVAEHAVLHVPRPRSGTYRQVWFEDAAAWAARSTSR